MSPDGGHGRVGGRRVRIVRVPRTDPAARREYNRQYREANRERLAEYKRAWHRERYANDPEFREKVLAANRSLPNIVVNAQRAVFRAIRKGTLVRPDTCEECDRSGLAIEAAHRDYAEPLDVRWLCRRCHRAWDAAEPKNPTLTP